ncbi:altronate dehydratase [Desulfosporosinus orientis DSM 765]|uniref:Altronate dehydratase n=1 Tax=Desulfosporosinus orientis (strain ATCC 19365 / DSM 765 / NCIMB 8382 / VKM B-1628 / Singapore I) TaxID=768706 RepID=G7WIA1_DESOD|nr:UxaA family hydrolase [Desulfosporosinus orientis]AET68549.1 altronate dehydratase [Desulfosporosinus orientis DSM 765]
MQKALKIDSRDNVAVVLSELNKGDDVLVNTESGALQLKVLSNIPFGHKIALKPLPSDEPIIKYGEVIGKAKTPIEPGEWVHLQNLYCERGRED